MYKKGMKITMLDEMFLDDCKRVEFITKGQNIGSYTPYDDETLTEFYDNICSCALDLANIENVHFTDIYIILL